MEGASSNAALMRRIVQLENERDDLRRDVETLCMQQSGESSLTSSLMAPLQTRRLAGLEQELESSRQKISLYTREVANLRDELSEVYHIKAQVSDLCKTETEKNRELEEELKFYQSKVSASISERDKLFAELEKTRQREQELEDDLKECQKRNKRALQEMERNAESLKDVTEKFDQLQSEVEVYNQVVKRFWDLRSPDHIGEDRTNLMEMSRCLLADPEGSWYFGDFASTEKELRKQVQELQTANAALESELKSSEVENSRLRVEIANEVKRKEEATERAAHVQQTAMDCASALSNSVHELKLLHGRLKEDISGILTSEQKLLEAAGPRFQGFAENLKVDETSFSGTGSRVISDLSDSATSSEEMRHSEPTVTREAFIQALQEKVAALMLLSQEEERHHLEVVTTGALEYQIKELNQKLSQVTLEKVEALMQVAQLKYDCQELKDRERELLRLLENPSKVGRLLPAAWAGTVEQADVTRITKSSQTKKKIPSTGSYLKSWLRGGDLYGFISNTTESAMTQTESSTPIAVARSKVENAALNERVTSLQQLLRSANRLQATLSTADDSDSLMSSLNVVNGAYNEAQRLKVALSSCSLPISWPGKVSDTNLEQMDDKAVMDLVSAAGMTLLELLIMTAELQRSALTTRLKYEEQ